jgi:hypothetical protein
VQLAVPTNKDGVTQPADPHNLRFIAEDGSEVTVADWRGRPVLLVFLRWLG